VDESIVFSHLSDFFNWSFNKQENVMSNRFTVLAAALLSFFALFTSGTNNAQAQNRRVMVEEFTGAWCGWCVRGALAIEQLYQKYPGKVVGVSIHNGDPMVTPSGDSLQAGLPGQASGTRVTGYPDGWTARQANGSTWNVNPGDWIDTVASAGLVDQLIGTPADATVTVDNVTFDLATSMVTARVSAKFNQAMSGDFRFNLYLTEDSVVYPEDRTADQHNYYYHNANFPGSPYYNLGTGANGNGVIKNFTHMHVLRFAAGGAWGTKGVIPPSAASGATYTQTYSFRLPGNVMNPNHVSVIGFVHQYNSSSLASNEILDAHEVPLNATPVKIGKPLELSVDGIPTAYAKANGDTSFVVNVTNNGTVSASVTEAIASTLPAGWSVRFDPSPLVVAAGATGQLTVTVTAPEQSAFIAPEITFMASEQDYYVPGSSLSFYMLSDNTKYAYLIPGGSYETAVYRGVPASYQTHMAIMPYSSSISQNYDFSDMDLVILNQIPVLDFYTDLGWGVAPTVGLLMDLLDKGKRVFINSNDAMFWAFNDADSRYQYTGTDAVHEFFDRMGLSWTRNVARYNSSTGAAISFPIKGTTDPIGNGISATNSGGDVSEIYSIDNSKSVGLFYTNGGSGNANTSYLLGSRYEDPSTHGRLVYLGFDLAHITIQKNADSIAARSIAWLLSGSSITPSLKVPQSVDFGSIPVGQSSTKTVTVSNEGSADVTVTGVSVTGSSFSANAAGFTVAAGASKTVDVTFAPSTPGVQDGKLVLVMAEGSQSIDLSGVAAAAGVEDGKTIATSFTASPNPFNGSTKIEYTAAAGERNVTFSVVDVLGREVMQLAPTASNGAYSVSFDGSNLSAGTYVIVAHTSTGSHELRVVNQH